MQKAKETKEVLKFVIELGEALDKALVDKKFEIHELSLLVGPLMQLGPAVEGFEQVKDELKSLTKEDMDELVKFVEDELELQAQDVEQIVEKALGTAVQIYSFAQLFRK